jgi:phosphate:Na+ symporter
VATAQQLLAEKQRFSELERRYHDTHLDRLAGQSVQAIETSSLHLDIISDMRRINSFFCSTAYPVLENAGKLRRSRLLETTGAYKARPELGGDMPQPH